MSENEIQLDRALFSMVEEVRMLEESGDDKIKNTRARRENIMKIFNKLYEDSKEHLEVKGEN